MSIEQRFQTYLTALRKHPLATKTEHTDRGALETLLQAVADEHSAATKVQHEPKRAQDKGAPDYKITRLGVMVGYVEAKQIGANLEAVLKTDQIKRYLDLNPNLVVTDYLRFIWIKDGKVKEAQEARLCEASAVESKLPLNPERIAEVEQLLRGFFLTAPKGVKRASELAEALAVRSRLLRDFLAEELQRQEKEDEGGKLLGLYKAFKEQVSHELKLDEFADAYAQTLAYGLFLAKLNVKPGEVITLGNAHDHVPAGFSLIRELVEFLQELNREEYRDIKWVVEEILSIVNHLNVEAIREDLSFKKRRAYSRGVRARSEEEWRLFSKDPFVYFYEDYLSKYDSKLRKSRGVYYTPPPIVNFIVRAINDILKDTFEIEQGLADRERVTVLDFACGTGTFLVEVLERIFDEIGGAESGIAASYVREHMLKNIYGFEYLIAPYTIAHLKLSQYLSDQAERAQNPNLALRNDERFQVYLTNTLEPIEPQKNYLLPELTHETEAAQAVKDKPILVILGNPPYAAKSKNRGPWIRHQVKAYEQVDGVHFRERKHWLNDDYVKFLRFAQLKIEERGDGIVGIICNRWWLENVTFRGMRQSLLKTFDQIHIFDLGGELGAEDDENVFDITKGVSIALFVRNARATGGARYASMIGSRLAKYETTATASLEELEWASPQPSSPNYFLVPRTERGRFEYESFWSIQRIFREGSTGVLTGRDRLAIAFSSKELQRTLDLLTSDTSDATIAETFELGEVSHWSLHDARTTLKTDGIRDKLQRCLSYRAFDDRFYYDDDALIFRRRAKIMQHMQGGTIGLAVCRLTKGGSWAHVLVTRHACDDSFLSDKSKERAYLFPIALNDGTSESYSADFRSFVDDRFEHHYAPEQILGYIYAVLHAPTFRSRYAEFLRIDFPRIPFVESSADFEALSILGSALVEAHLLRKVKRRELGKYLGHKQGDDENRVLDVRYAEGEQAIYINDTQRFAPIPPATWNFHIGGYQVLEKYLKSRRNRVLTLDEIEHIAKVADVLAFTIEQMAAIDVAYRAAFPQHARSDG